MESDHTRNLTEPFQNLFPFSSFPHPYYFIRNFVAPKFKSLMPFNPSSAYLAIFISAPPSSYSLKIESVSFWKSLKEITFGRVFVFGGVRI